MAKIVECVANFSEGRRLHVVDDIVNTISAVPGATVLDRESDADHNRSVITFVGTPEAIVDAAFAAIKTAAKHIDLDTHTGEHPRLGATDVVPFIPIDGVTMADCVELARQLGARVGDELNIPVYLYEAAATRPDHENLANVRKGQYELLKQEIGKNPDRDPDFGPKALGKAGATIIGARAPLVAYNVYLNTTNIDVAKTIGKAVRHLSGGLRFVKALGMEVDGKAQVSMNLTDYSRTPIYRVVEMIRREAARYGVMVERSEIIGLVPQQALIDAAEWYLQIDGFSNDLILEHRLAAAQTEQKVLPGADFINALADSTPTPGGGSAAAYSGAMAAALVQMVAGVTVGKKKYADVEKRMQEIMAEAGDLRAALHAGVPADAESFNEVIEAFRMPKDTDADKRMRAEAIERATHTAAKIPLDSARRALRVLELAAEVAETGNANAVTDAGSAGALAATAIHAAGMNVRINAAGVKDKVAAQSWFSTLSEIETKADELRERLHAAIRERGGIEV